MRIKPGHAYLYENDFCDVIVLGLLSLMSLLRRQTAVYLTVTIQIWKRSVWRGGDAANQAVLLAKLGRKVSLSCRVGDDAFGSFISGQMQKHGVDTSRISVSADSATGVSVVLVSKGGKRCFLCKRGNNRDFCRADLDFSRIARARALSVAGLLALPGLENEGLLELFKTVKKSGLLTFADTMIRQKDASLSDISAFLPYIDYFLPSEEECRRLLHGCRVFDAAQSFIDAGAANVVIKQGSKGVYARCADFSGHVPAFAIKPKDTTGSGDAFCAGLIHAKLAGAGTREALDYACACGAFNAMHLGAAGCSISDDVISTFLRTTKGRMEASQKTQ